MRYFMIALVLLAIPALCSAEIYKWVDEKGQTGYSDDLGKVPIKYRDSVVVEEKQEQAVEIVESVQPEKSAKKDVDAKGESQKDAKGQDKEKPMFDGKSGEAWKKDFAQQKYQIKSLEEQSAGLKERMTSGSKMSRGEYLTLQNTQRDLEVRIGKAKGKLDAMIQAADKAEVPQEFR